MAPSPGSIGAANPDRLASRCDYVGVIRRDPQFLLPHRPHGVSRVAVALWLAMLVAVIFLSAFWLARLFAL